MGWMPGKEVFREEFVKKKCVIPRPGNRDGKTVSKY
jgi:hypothetical protein